MNETTNETNEAALRDRIDKLDAEFRVMRHELAETKRLVVDLMRNATRQAEVGRDLDAEVLASVAVPRDAP